MIAPDEPIFAFWEQSDWLRPSSNGAVFCISLWLTLGSILELQLDEVTARGFLSAPSGEMLSDNAIIDPSIVEILLDPGSCTELLPGSIRAMPSKEQELRYRIQARQDIYIILRLIYLPAGDP